MLKHGGKCRNVITAESALGAELSKKLYTSTSPCSTKTAPKERVWKEKEGRSRETRPPQLYTTFIQVELKQSIKLGTWKVFKVQSFYSSSLISFIA